MRIDESDAAKGGTVADPLGPHAGPEEVPSEPHPPAQDIAKALPAKMFEGVDVGLLARLLEGVSNVYREAGGRVVARDQARIAGDLYAEVIAAVPEPDEAARAGAAALALNRLRQELRASASQPAETKRQA